jgi:glycosyltransferase involved in cell wall biosynthesis
MRILFCCEWYAPSVGGVQEVMRQVAERLVARGHTVTVATTRLPMRDFKVLNGVFIEEFEVYGNFVGGISGEIERYQQYVVAGNFDVVMIKAAQQWTFDALWPVLDNILTPKVFIPCGFSSLYQPTYAQYFAQMPEVLKKFNHLIFYASKYRDIDFARQHGLHHFTVIPNGASELEFNIAVDTAFRKRHDILEQSFLFLTVGSLTGLKGHLELAKAFARIELDEGQHATLILNGNECRVLENNISERMHKLVGVVRAYGFKYAFKHVFKNMLAKMGFTIGLVAKLKKIRRRVNKSHSNKKVLLTDYPRHELTQAFMAADLFVFASNVEYSPLVLFESAAAGTPFLSVSVGNSAEIAQWTGAGIICPSSVDGRGYTKVDEAVLAQSMSSLMKQKDLLAELGASGKRNWSERFTWEKISSEYEQVFLSIIRK